MQASCPASARTLFFHCKLRLKGLHSVTVKAQKVEYSFLKMLQFLIFVKIGHFLYFLTQVHDRWKSGFQYHWMALKETSNRPANLDLLYIVR